MAWICFYKRLLAFFQEKHSPVLFAVLTSSCVVMGRARIGCGCRSLVPYPVKVIISFLFPLTEVCLKCTRHIAGWWCSCIWCRKKNRISTIRFGILSLFGNALLSLTNPCSWKIWRLYNGMGRIDQYWKIDYKIWNCKCLECVLFYNSLPHVSS